ncbi:hypothetical protein JCM6882_008286 [Rhodosporidiobolus microsporus]
MPACLSRELIEKVLDDPGLDEQTIARCTRLSRTFLEYGRTRLYETVTIPFVTVPSGLGDPIWELSRTGTSTFHRICRFPSVAKSIRRIRFDYEYADSEGGLDVSPNQIFEAIMRRCPNLDSLELLPGFEEECETFFQTVYPKLRRNIKSLDLGRPGEGLWDVLEAVQDSLVELKFGDKSNAGWYGVEDPPSDDLLPNLHLETLHIECWGDEDEDDVTKQQAVFDALTENSLQSLRTLSLEYASDILNDFSSFTNLRRLTLNVHATYHGFDALSDTPALPASLTSLTLSGLLLPDEADKLFGDAPETGILRILPSKLEHLRLPQGLFPRHLLAFLAALPSSSKLRFVETPRTWRNSVHWPTPESEAEDDLGPVVEAFAENGIRVEVINGGEWCAPEF